MSIETPEKPRVLIVEDEEPLAEVYQEFLAGRFDTEAVHGGDEALATVDETVDVVLLDRRMPGTSGDEVLRTLRAESFDGQIVMATAAYPDFDIVEVGFDNYIVKPIDRDELIEVVEQTLAQGTYERKLQEYYELDARRARLEATISDDRLEESREYRELTARLDRIRDQMDDLLEEFEGPGFAATVERTQTMAALRESEERYRSMTEDVLDTSDVGTVVIDADGRIEWATERWTNFFDIDRETVLQREYEALVRETVGPAIAEVDDATERLLQSLEENTGVDEFQCRIDGPGDAEARWLKRWSKPIEHGLFAGGRIEHYYDITPLKEREETLEALHGATRRLIDSESPAEIGEAVVDVAVDILGAAGSAVYLREDDSGQLTPAAVRSPGEDVAEPEPIPPGEGPIWSALVEGEVREVTESEPGRPFLDLEAVLVLPIGNHGVLVLGYPTMEARPVATRAFADILAANTEVTLDRAARERTLVERDEELEWRNQQLQRLNRINTAIRSIGQVLIDASTRDQIEAAVCERLSQLDTVRFVWMGEPDPVSGAVRPTAWAGEAQAYLEAISLDPDADGEDGPPATTVADRRQPVVIDNLIEAGSRGDWRSIALNHGFQSMAAIPVVYDQSLYGVLEVYADRPTVFGADERDVLSELGETIGHGINAVNQRNALFTDELIDLEFAVDRADGFLFALADAEAAPVELRAMIPQSDGSYLAFVAVGGTDGRIKEVAEAAPDVTDIHLVRENEGDRLWKCRLTESTVVHAAAEVGAIPTSVRAEGDRFRLVVSVPRSMDVRTVQQQLTDRGVAVELVARRERSAGDTVKEALNERIHGALTDRQREALQSAYFSGYFEWPREANGEDVAEALAIDQSTFQQHLRAGQRHVFETLFDSL